jgi:two-component system chemotaxis sensor kinase CheA
MSQDPLEAIKQTFFQECEEQLLAMEEGLIALESGEADSETINAVFRAVHSIKGGGGAFGFEALVRFAHGFETVLDHLRSGRLAAGGDAIKTLLRASDMLADHVGWARGGKPVQDDSEIIAELAALSGEEPPGEEDPAPADFEGLAFTPMIVAVEDAAPPQGWSIRFVPAPALYANANEPLLLIRALGALGDICVTADLSGLPSWEALDPAAAWLGWDITLSGDIARERIDEIFDFVTGACELHIAALGEAATDPPAVPDLPEMPRFAPPPEPVAQKEAVPEKPSTVPDAPRPTIRVDLDKVDRLVNLVGELVITQAMLSQRAAELPKESQVGGGLADLEHLVRELQESVMAIRTQPVKSVFQRMPRLVRELASQTGKKVRLVVEGETTEVDKTVIERLGEPLTHMIRNAIDHGLETPEERRAAGKPEEGTVTLSAEHRGGRIMIEVGDDGRGIDRTRVRQKAAERGLIPPGAALSDEETDNLIFMPGFSTASQVSNISGRGVGMDVVRRNIIDLGGRIGIGSTPHQGSRFSLTLPLTLAVLDGMVVAIGSQTFVLPLSHIVESLKPKSCDIKPFGERRLLNVRGAHVPLIDTGAVLGVEDALPAEQGVVILVESQGTGRLALAVDAIIGQRQVVIKSFEDNYRPIAGIAAATILGDGRVALILDVDGLVARCRGQLADTEPLLTGT